MIPDDFYNLVQFLTLLGALLFLCAFCIQIRTQENARFEEGVDLFLAEMLEMNSDLKVQNSIDNPS